VPRLRHGGCWREASAPDGARRSRGLGGEAAIASVKLPQGASRPASVIRTFVTSTSLAPARTLSYVIVTRPAVDQASDQARARPSDEETSLVA
jgi:hypothetical protein